MPPPFSLRMVIGHTHRGRSWLYKGSSVACLNCVGVVLLIRHQSIHNIHCTSSRLSGSQCWLIVHQHGFLSARWYLGALEVFFNKLVVRYSCVVRCQNNTALAKTRSVPELAAGTLSALSA